MDECTDQPILVTSDPQERLKQSASAATGTVPKTISPVGLVKPRMTSLGVTSGDSIPFQARPPPGAAP